MFPVLIVLIYYCFFRESIEIVLILKHVLLGLNILLANFEFVILMVLQDGLHEESMHAECPPLQEPILFYAQNGWKQLNMSNRKEKLIILVRWKRQRKLNCAPDLNGLFSFVFFAPKTD